MINGKAVRLNVAGPRPDQRMEPARHRGGASAYASPAPSSASGQQRWPGGGSLDAWPAAPAPPMWQQSGMPDLTSGIAGGPQGAPLVGQGALDGSVACRCLVCACGWLLCALEAWCIQVWR